MFSAFEAKMEAKMAGLEGMVAVALQDVTCTKESLFIFADELQSSIKNSTTPKEKPEDVPMWLREMDALREEIQMILKEVSEKKHHAESIADLKVDVMENAAQILQQFQVSEKKARDEIFAELKKNIAQVQKELQESHAHQQLLLLEGKSARERQDYKMLDLEAKISKKVWHMDGVISKFTNYMDASLGNAIEAKPKSPSAKLRDNKKDGTKMWSTDLTSLRGELEELRRTSQNIHDDRSTQIPSDASDCTMSSAEERSGKREADANTPVGSGDTFDSVRRLSSAPPNHETIAGVPVIVRSSQEPPQCGQIGAGNVRLSFGVAKKTPPDAHLKQEWPQNAKSRLDLGSMRAPVLSPAATPRSVTPMDLRKTAVMVGQQPVTLGARPS